MKQLLYSLTLIGGLTAATAVTGQTIVDRTNTAAYEMKRAAMGNGFGATGVRGVIANDECTGAEMLTVGDACVAVPGSADGATESSPAEACNGFTSDTAVDVWYSFVATSEYTIVEATGGASTDSTGYDAVVLIYTGDCADLTGVECADATLRGETESVTFQTTIGTTYTYRVYYFDYGTEQIDLDFTTCVYNAPPPPANDLCESVTPVAIAIGGSETFTGNNTGALDTEGIGFGSVWHAFTTPDCADVTVDYCGTDPAFENGFVSLFIGCPFTSNIPATSNDATTCGDGNFSLFYNSLPAGTYYYAVMLDPANNAEGDYTINVSVAAAAVPCPEPPANDDCAGAIMLTPGTTCIGTPGTSVGATETIAPILCNGFTAGDANDVFYSFVATSTSHSIGVLGIASYDAVIEFFTGTCDDLVSVGCTDETFPNPDPENEDMIQDGLTVGTTYYFRVYDFNNDDASSFEVCVTEGQGSGVGIEDVAARPDMTVFPNPGAGMFTVRTTGISGNATIEVFDVTGRTVYVNNSVLTAGADHMMDLTGVVAGNYNVRLTAEGVSTIQRVVVK